MNIYTIGHSNHSAHEFLQLLKAHEIECLVDIRSLGSHQPQFSNDVFPLVVRSAGIYYERIKDLGGFRKSKHECSENDGWNHPSFHSYADYALTDKFKEALFILTIIARKYKTAFCCSESKWWQCHRRIVSDYLTVMGVIVDHIMSATKTEQHELTKFAVVDGKKIIYPRGEN